MPPGEADTDSANALRRPGLRGDPIGAQKGGDEKMAHEPDEVITLVDEDGQEHNFTLLDIVSVDEQRYAVLLPEEDPEEGAVIFRIDTDEEGEDLLVDIEDDDEFERVVSALEELDAEDEEEADGEDDTPAGRNGAR